MNGEYDILIPNSNTNGIRKLGEVNTEALMASLQPYIDSFSNTKKQVSLRTGIKPPEPNTAKIDQSNFVTWANNTQEVQSIAEQFSIPSYGRVRLFLLSSMSTYAMHGDDDFYRVHIPLITNDASFLIVDNRLWKLDVGSVYLVKVKDPHTAINAGRTNRIHLVFDNCEKLL